MPRARSPSLSRYRSRMMTWFVGPGKETVGGINYYYQSSVPFNFLLHKECKVSFKAEAEHIHTQRTAIYKGKEVSSYHTSEEVTQFSCLYKTAPHWVKSGERKRRKTTVQVGQKTPRKMFWGSWIYCSASSKYPTITNGQGVFQTMNSLRRF